LSKAFFAYISGAWLHSGFDSSISRVISKSDFAYLVLFTEAQAAYANNPHGISRP
jgi:hypothetical protein